MHAWNDDRGKWIAQKMRWLYGHGCDVKLMVGFAGRSVRQKFAERTHRGYLPVHATGQDTNDDGLIDLYTHQKELLISGNYAGSRHSRLVVTGSSNYNIDGVRGDEEIFLIKNRTRTWNEYIHDFQRMWTKFSTRVKYIPYPSATTNVRAMGAGALDDPLLQPVAPKLIVAPSAKPGGPAWEND
jgi:phosphatidylserine/phosphatidylglycerophosphate/cardiolipin synthase-like enzyme